VNNKEHSKILILDGHSKAAAAAVLALPARSELHVAATEEDCLCFASPRIARKLAQPRAVAKLRTWIEQLDRDENFDLIIPSTEASLLAVKPDDLDPALRAKAVVPSEASLDVALDKQRTLALADRLGVRIPHGRAIAMGTGLPVCATWPTVIKPIRSKVALHDETLSLSVRICANASQREEALADLLPLSPVLEQDYFRGRGFGVEVLFEHGEPRWWFAHERIHELPITGGASSYRRSIDVPANLREATLDLLTHLRWHGVAMVEFKMADDGDYRLMEINPRLWGSLPLAIAAGVNFPLALLHMATGRPIGQQPRYRRHQYARDVVKDVHWFEDSVRERNNPLRVAPAGARDVAALLRPLTGRECWDLFRWREPGIWWHTVRPAFAGLQSRFRRLYVNSAARLHWRRLAPAWRDGRIRLVLVLCRGNMFRSPVAAAMLERSAVGLTATSAGTDPLLGYAPSGPWLELVRQSVGVDMRKHQPRAVDSGDISRADLILAMDVESWRALAAIHPDAMHKTVLLGVAGAAQRSAPIEIRDPRDGDQTTFRAIISRLQRCTENLVRQRNVHGPVAEHLDQPGAARQ
jgi:protein-tyrosine-phosphatase/predicted ATP-grasp superfamily ATP-dependent carboligase